MKHFPSGRCLVASVVWLTTLTTAARAETGSLPGESIPASELGAKAGAQYHGDGLSVAPTPDGAVLCCVFQKLEGQVTREGLWLVSTVEPQTGEKFRLVAAAVGREGVLLSLPSQGTVTVTDKLVRYARPGLAEEYSVSVDGVRQDFVITERPASDGDLRVELALTGARADATAYGAQLTLDNSKRALAYSRLRVVDVNGKELSASLEVLAADRLAVRVVDTTAVYPVRIDPTFSDADWVSLNPGLPGAENEVYAITADGIGNVYSN